MVHADHDGDQVVHIVNPHLYAWINRGDWERGIVPRNRSDPRKIGIPSVLNQVLRSHIEPCIQSERRKERGSDLRFG